VAAVAPAENAIRIFLDLGERGRGGNVFVVHPLIWWTLSTGA
jgi:hypothetical protein